MDDILINAILERVKSGGMIIEQVPIPYREELKKKLSI